MREGPLNRNEEGRLEFKSSRAGTVRDTFPVRLPTYRIVRHPRRSGRREYRRALIASATSRSSSPTALIHTLFAGWWERAILEGNHSAAWPSVEENIVFPLFYPLLLIHTRLVASDNGFL